MSQDPCVEHTEDDELPEVTPVSLRIRKRLLDTHVHGREDKRAKEAIGA